jgi:predicted metal-dependent hydrolase
MFIDAVKAHRDGVPEKLEREIRAFVQQEVMHSREHVSFNKRVVDAGYDTTSLERTVDEVLALINARPKIVNLCATIALEHYTAILAQMFLNDPMAFNGSEGEEAQLWKWHAIEEIEHKGVAYDTWLHATRDWSRFRRWRMKAIMMTLVTLRFWPKRIRGMLDLLAQDGLTGWRVKARVAWFMLGKPGVLRRVFLPWLAFFMPGFHPWNEDDRHLIALNDSDYEAARLPQALAA